MGSPGEASLRSVRPDRNDAAMAVESLSASEALQLPVLLRGIQLGRPIDLLLDRNSWHVLGFVVRCRDELQRFLPLAAAQTTSEKIAVGSALMLLMMTGGILFVAGLHWWKFAAAAIAVAGAVPLGWNFLRDYQKARVLTFLDPTRDPLGTGYHIIQSKIALGSGALFGKGFLQGTQSHLNFLPEKQTDFIFTMFAEEFGMVGSLTLLGLYLLMMVYGYAIAFRSSSQFGRLLAIGVVLTLFLAMFVNMAMVMGLIPAKGVALPMVSYGGSSLVVTMFGFGLLMSVWVHRDMRIGRRGTDD